MDSYYIITNYQKDQDLSITKQISDYLKSRGKICRFLQNSLDAGDKRYTYAAEPIPAGTECVIVLGGDGTLIQAAGELAKRRLPVLLVNLGTLGYLAEIEKDQIIPALDRLICDEYEVEERMMLYGEAFRGGMSLGSAVALNDVVITRRGSLRVINFDVYVNNRFLNNYSGDGIIIATPTGSTGYSLSAGGPIVDPKGRLFILTPVCPHTLNARSIVLSDEDLISVRIGPGRRAEEELAEDIYDGGPNNHLITGDEIRIRKAKQVVRMIKLNKESFLDVLRNKLSR